jgi:hypothetical protein
MLREVIVRAVLPKTGAPGSDDRIAESMSSRAGHDRGLLQTLSAL